MPHNPYTLLSDWQESKEVIMGTLLILIVLCIVLDIAAVRWGFDSTEKLDSQEWERRTGWRVLEERNTARHEKL